MWNEIFELYLFSHYRNYPKFNLHSQGMSLPIVYVKNLPRDVTSTALFGLFDLYGEIHQIRVNPSTSSAFVIFKHMNLAKQALAMSGINFQGRYLVVILYQANVNKADMLNEEQLKLLTDYTKPVES